jgi:hypothetical protein
MNMGYWENFTRRHAPARLEGAPTEPNERLSLATLLREAALQLEIGDSTAAAVALDELRERLAVQPEVDLDA